MSAKSRLRGNVFINKRGPAKDLKVLEKHLRYIGFRSRELQDEQRGFFDKNGNGADFKRFYQRVAENPALQHSKMVKAHKLVFSLRGKDYEAYKKSGRDYQDIIKRIMNDYEKKHKVKLDWIAAIHENKDHPHCHVVIKGVSDEAFNGRFKRIFFKAEDRDDFRTSFDREIEDHAVYPERHPSIRESDYKDLTMNFAMDRLLNDLSASLDREAKRSQHEQERAKRKAQNQRGEGR